MAGIAGRGELRPVDAFGARARRVAKVTECRLDASLALVPRAPSLAVPRARGRPLSPAVTPGTSADAMSQPEPHLAAVASANAGGRVALYPTADLAGQLAGRRAPATLMQRIFKVTNDGSWTEEMSPTRRTKHPPLPK